MKLKPDYKKRILSLTSDGELKEVLKSLVDHFEYSIEDIESLSELTAKEKGLLSEKVLNNVVELKEFDYYYDEKVTVWIRNHFTIEARSQEDADAIAIENMIEPWGIEVNEADYLYETDEGLSPENNGGKSTIELYSKRDDDNPLYENGE
jgi:hypothetical protein